ncbi:MAG TPA: MFS transporter [Steroidobacteraceae bacterium]|nr:MFS transporter [Steroidobacteraceae bacterium]
MSTGRSRHYHLALLMLSNLCVSVSWGIVSPTIVANSLQRGSSTLIIGVLTSIWALPFLLAAPVYTRIVGRINAKPALLVGMLTDAGVVWLFPLVPNDWAWIFLQIVTGAMLGHFSLITTAWLNLFASDQTRARLLSLYGVVPAIGYALGAAFYAFVGYRGYAPYLASSAALVLGVLPVLLIRKEAADVVLGGEERLRHAFRRTPFLLTVALLAGVLELVPWSLMQVYAVANQWSTRAAGFALPMFYWGQVLLTYPLGWVADRAPMRNVLLGMSAAAIVCMVALALFARTPGMWGVIFLTGGIATATYTLGMAILGQRFDAGTLVSANAAFIACYGVGTILGPPLVGALMDRFGPNALPIALGCASAGIFACASAARIEWQRPLNAPTLDLSGR